MADVEERSMEKNAWNEGSWEKRIKSRGKFP